jgi:hypothetical protein
MNIIKNLRFVSGLAPISNRRARGKTARIVVFASLRLAAVTALVAAAWVTPSSAGNMTGKETGETVARWNRNAIAVLLPTNPPELTRSLAMTHIALHDAANAVRPKYARYAYHITEDTGADPSVAAAVAAAEVLKHRRPAKAADINALVAVDLATVRDPERLQNSINVGQAAAAAIIALRANDGSTSAATPYTPGTEPGDYQPTAAIVLLPGWGNVTPFAMIAGNQFGGNGPHALTSAEYTADYNEVKDYGSATSTVRTGDQTAEARFWIENPPTVFNRVAQREITNQDLDLWQAARGMALTQIAFADAIISSWNTKFTYNFWRPITAIRNGDLDGNDATIADPTWTPLNVTPPFPEYNSAHAVVAAASATILTDVFGPVAFTETSTATGIVRTYDSWLHAAVASTDSRIWGGFHFRDACEDGEASGLALGQYILDLGLFDRLPE